MLLCTVFACRLVNYLMAQSQSQKEICWQDQLKEFFEVIEEDGKNVKVRCRQCLPANKVLSAAKSTPANLFKHVEVSILGS